MLESSNRFGLILYDTCLGTQDCSLFVGGSNTTCLLRVVQSAASPSPLSRTTSRLQPPVSALLFSTSDQPLPARLIRLLLLKAGIESNPGPQQWHCTVCTSQIYRRHYSVQCSRCSEWLHHRPRGNNCGQLLHIADYDQLTYTCPRCLQPDIPTQLPPSPSSPRQTDTPAEPHASSPNPFSHLKILQFNCNGLARRMDEIMAFIVSNNIQVAALQETKTSATSRIPSLPGYTILRRDRARNGGGGLAFIIHGSLQFEQLTFQTTEPMEVQLIRLHLSDTNLDIANIYLPPTSSCPPAYQPSIESLLSQEGSRLLLGDFNAHHHLWDSTSDCPRGNRLYEEISNSTYGVLNDDTHPTRCPTNGDPSSPDVSLASADILAYTTWATSYQLSSDHLPITISVEADCPPRRTNKKTFRNLKKARWPSFQEETELHLSCLPLPLDLDKGLKAFNQILTTAAKHHVPAGRVLNFVPSFPAEASEISAIRDTRRANNPTDPSLPSLNNQIDTIVKNHKRSKWHDHLSTFSINTNSSRLWSTVRNLNNGPPAPSNQAICFGESSTTNKRDIATNFNKQFTSVRAHTSNRMSRIVRRTTQKKPFNDAIPFTASETAAAIRGSNTSPSFGPDDICILYLKHLGPSGLAFLTHLFNLSIQSCRIPNIWKSSIILPKLKAGKDPSISTSYRPISLLCPAIKVLERLLLPHIMDSAELSTHQHGFRPHHSTTTALHHLLDHISSGFNKPKPPDRSVLVALDLSKAFDSVDIDQMADLLNQSSLPTYLIRWLSAYLRGRQSKVSFEDNLSTSRNVKTGVPQGAVTSPLLFNIYLADLPQPPPNIKVISYADDISIVASGPSIPENTAAINAYLPSVLNFLETRQLTVSTEKSTVTLLSPDSHEFNIHPDVHINGRRLPLNQHPKILGVYLDPTLSLNHHVMQQVKKTNQRVNVLKALAGTTWGQDTETLITTYRATCKSVLEYAAPIITPLLSETSWKKLQVVENSALRVATGCLKMTPTDHLHQETQVVPVKRHCQLLAKQYLQKALLPIHPCHNLLSRPPPRRNKKATLVDLHRPLLTNLLSRDLNSFDIEALNRETHRQTVLDAINAFTPNRVLNDHPPAVNVRRKERAANLPRRTRTLLSQLRAGVSTLLNCYRTRIPRMYPDTPNTCPDCGIGPHDTPHLFSCPSHPTVLQPVHLWTHPRQAASFLQLPIAEDDL